MEHSLPLISTLVIGFSLALVFGFIVERFFNSPALVGYLLAGIAAGQYTPGVYADLALANQLSEIGIMLLMFGVGLHFSIKDLLSVKGIALPGAVLQMFCATVLGAVAAHTFFDRHWVEAFALGLSLSCASTVVLLKALEARGILTGTDGRIAVGWLVVEDLATVVILVMLPPLAEIFGPGGPGAHAMDPIELLTSLGKTLAGAALFVVLMLIVGRRVLPWAVNQVAKTGSRELFTLFILACAVGIAYGAAAFFSVSFALGAFFAGMVMQESKFAHRAATESLPLQDAFAVLFFVAVGMLFDWHVVINNFWEVLAVLLTIIVGKSLCAFFLVWALKYPLHTAITVAVSLAQIGEFSFILAGEAANLGLATRGLLNLVVAGAIISIAINPVLFSLTPKIADLLTKRFVWARKAAMREAPFEALDEEVVTPVGHLLLAGSGSMLISLVKRLSAQGIFPIVLTDSEVEATELKEAGFAAVVGDMTRVESWVAAHAHSSDSVILMDKSTEAVSHAYALRAVSADVSIVVLGHDPSVWEEAGIDKLRFLSVEDAALTNLTASISTAFKAHEPIGQVVNRKEEKKEAAPLEDAEAAVQTEDAVESEAVTAETDSEPIEVQVSEAENSVAEPAAKEKNAE